jgi:hypothetical protein
MADPRKAVRFQEVGQKQRTYKIDNSTITYSATAANGSASVGLAVTMSADDTVALTGDADRVRGRLEQVFADGYCSVTDEGYVELPGGTGAALTRGKAIVGDLLAAAKGYIREVDTAVAAELGKMGGEIINNGVTTAVVVKL